jgi:hypothetical protein
MARLLRLVRLCHQSLPRISRVGVRVRGRIRHELHERASIGRGVLVQRRALDGIICEGNAVLGEDRFDLGRAFVHHHLDVCRAVLVGAAHAK